MNKKPYILIAIFLSIIGTCLAAVDYNMERYKVILDREPFGSAPIISDTPVAAPDPLIPETAPKFIKSLRMCAITDTEEFGLRIGIVDIKAKPAKSYFFHVGETQDGLELLEADFEKEGALIKKDDKAFWLYLDGTTGNGRDGTASSENSSTPSVLTPTSRKTVSARGTVSRKGSYAERLRKRREILDARRKKNKEYAEANKDKTPEELKAKLEEYQMELIRAGGTKGPAMPIALTKEMDDQLVEEGVLPPQE